MRRTSERVPGPRRRRPLASAETAASHPPQRLVPAAHRAEHLDQTRAAADAPRPLLRPAETVAAPRRPLLHFETAAVPAPLVPTTPGLPVPSQTHRRPFRTILAFQTERPRPQHPHVEGAPDAHLYLPPGLG